MAAVGWLAVSRRGLLGRQNPGCQLFSFCITHLRVGWHGDWAPNATATFLNFGGEFVDCGFVRRIFGGDVFEAGTHELFVRGMASHAVFG